MDDKGAHRKLLRQLPLAAGTVGGAAGAMWVVNTMANPKISPKAKNAVVQYDGMPTEGARPVDIAGLTSSGTPLHPCLVDFLDEQRAVIGEAEWTKVRLHPYFKDEDDILNQLAFARGALGITRGKDIYVNVPYTPSSIDRLNETLLFHELAHVAQYASGMDLPEYISSSASSFAAGQQPKDNAYEVEAHNKAEELLDLWALSPQRTECHPDQREQPHMRAISEQPEISFAIFSSTNGEYELVRHKLHEGRFLIERLPEGDVEAGLESDQEN